MLFLLEVEELVVVVVMEELEKMKQEKIAKLEFENSLETSLEDIWADVSFHDRSTVAGDFVEVLASASNCLR